MSNDRTLEEELQYLGEISRYNIACGFYGDTQWQVWDDNGVHVEYEEHEAIVKAYKEEVGRLQLEFEKVKAANKEISDSNVKRRDTNVALRRELYALQADVERLRGLL